MDRWNISSGANGAPTWQEPLLAIARFNEAYQTVAAKTRGAFADIRALRLEITLYDPGKTNGEGESVLVDIDVDEFGVDVRTLARDIKEFGITTLIRIRLDKVSKRSMKDREHPKRDDGKRRKRRSATRDDRDTDDWVDRAGYRYKKTDA